MIKIFEDFKEDKFKEEFVHKLKLNELTIRYDFIYENKKILYFNNIEYIFNYNKHDKNLYLTSKLCNSQYEQIIINVIEEYFNIKISQLYIEMKTSRDAVERKYNR